MSQPIYYTLAQLGDVNPLSFGGQWVLKDTTGVYPEEVEYLRVPDEAVDEDAKTNTVWRLVLDKCTFIDGILSDNKHHPEHRAWFADRIAEVAQFCDQPVETLIADLCSSDPVDRARAYVSMAEFFGFDNFDSSPLNLSHNECLERYSHPQYQYEGQRIPLPNPQPTCC